MWILGLVVVVAIVAWLIAVYNRLIVKRNETQNARAQIEVQLNRRYDLIPNLVEVAKRYMAHEETVLTAVAKAREQGLNALAGMGSAMGAQMALLSSLQMFYARAENYPALKADREMLNLHEELRSTENRIAFARQYFNDVVTDYNNALQVIPDSWVAFWLGFRPLDLLDLPAVELPDVATLWK